MGHRIKVLHFLMEQQMNRELAAQDLTSAQGRIIGYLCQQEQAPCARDLEEFFHLSHPTVSGLLNRMESKGLIEFRTDGMDRRIKRIYPLEKGMASFQQIVQSIKENEERMVRGFLPEEKELFGKLLERATHNLCQCAHQSNEEQEETV